MKIKIINELSQFNSIISITSNLWISYRVLEYPYTRVTIYTTLTHRFNKYKMNKSIFSITFDYKKSNDKVVNLMMKH